jgi:hypothetical protein
MDSTNNRWGRNFWTFWSQRYKQKVQNKSGVSECNEAIKDTKIMENYFTCMYLEELAKRQHACQYRDQLQLAQYLC